MSRTPCLPLAAVLLAAGAATRMGRQKQLLPYRGSTLVEHAAAQALAASFSPVIVVVGAGSQTVRASLAALPVSIVENPLWEQGMGSSIAAGVSALLDTSSEAAAVAILLADQPLVEAAALLAMRDIFIHQSPAIVAARYSGSLGVPALFARRLFPALAALKGQTGARALLHDPSQKVVAYDLPEAARDIDTPADFASLTDD